MELTAQIVFWTLVALILGQMVLVYGFAIVLATHRHDQLRDAECPRAVVVLCLRGTDPFLEQCLTAITGQDYPDYEVRVIVDCADDPAREVVEKAIRESRARHVHIENLNDPRSTCSLKCSSVVQAMQALDDEVGFVAQLDADTVPHPTWLRELAAALREEKVGAATGNRWYMPEHLSTGVLIRYVWNAAAVVQMYWYGIPWGGTLAIKTQVLRDSDLLERWSNALCEDTMLYAVLRRMGLRVKFVPSLMMVNREDCTVVGFHAWVKRQLLTARLYHPGWPLVVGHGVLTTIVPFVALALLIASAITSQWMVAAWMISGILMYELSIIPVLTPLEWSVRRLVRARGEPTAWMGIRGAFWFVAAIPATQIVYAAALASAVFLRSIVWRGVAYRIGGPWKIRMAEYFPYQPETHAHEKKSL